MFNDNYIASAHNVSVVGFFKKIKFKKGDNGSFVFTSPHYHSDMEIICITGGSGEFFVSNRRYVFKKGDAFFINPYELHYGNADKRGEFSYYCIDFSLGLISHGFGEKYVSGEKHVKNFCRGEKKIETLVHEICAGFKQKGAQWEFLAKGCLFLIFAEIERKKLFSKSETGETGGDFVKKVYSYIEKAFERDITSKDAAKMCGYNQSYFCRQTKKSFGCNFGELLNIYRIKRAKSLIENGQIAVTKIAASCGFNNVSYFSKTFKRISGLTATQYISLVTENKRSLPF